MENPTYTDKSSFRIGIIVNQTNLEDILYYNKELQDINKIFPYI